MGTLNLDGNRRTRFLRAGTGGQAGSITPPGGGGAGPPPEPASTVAIWWAADLALSDGDPVASWVDRVNTVAVDQAVAGDRPLYRTAGINGRPTVDFVSADYLRLAQANALTAATQGVIIVVCLLDTVASSPALWATSDEAGNNNTVRGIATTTFEIGQRNADTDTVVRSPAASIATATAYILEWSSTGTAYELRINNAVQGKTVASGTDNGDWFGDTSARDNFTIGALRRTTVTNVLDGDIGLVLVADAQLSAGDRTDLYDWLSAHYGITI